MEILYIRDDLLRPFELIGMKILQEKRQINSSEEKRAIVEDRIKRRMTLCRDEDKRILDDSLVIIDIKTELLIQRQKLELNRELDAD